MLLKYLCGSDCDLKVPMIFAGGALQVFCRVSPGLVHQA